MKKLACIFALMLSITASTASIAQGVCATPYGACAMNIPGAPGGPCFCITAAGNIQGVTQATAVGAAPTDPFPHYCCTQAGKMGPYPNTSTGIGQVCQAVTPAGALIGQACF
jgi:hypothetical protein